jgi:addiction module RelE/StbE family toxin
MNVNLSPRFKRAYKKLPADLKDDFDNKIKLFLQDPQHPSLRTHKLKGRLQSCLAFRLKDGYRVLFEFSSSETVDLLDIGPHDIYKKR